MRRAWGVLTLAAALLFAPGPAVHGDAPAAVRLAGEPAATADPGAVVRRAVVVENTGNAPFDARVDVVAPQGIELVSGPAVQRVGPGDWAVVPITVRVAPSAPPRSFPVLYAVYAVDGGDATFITDGVVTVTVAERAGLDLAIASSPAFAPAGVSFPLAVRLANTGNTALDLTLDLRSSGGSSAAIRPQGDRVTLPAGESREVELALTAPASLPASTVDRIEVTASDPARGAAARSAAYVELIPEGGAGAELARYPLRLATTGELSASGATTTLGLLASASGASTLGFGDDYRLAFELAKAVESTGALADPDPRDRAFVGLAGPAFAVNAGDAVRALSPLVLPQRETFGVDARVVAGSLRAEASVQEVGPADEAVALASAGVGYGATPPGSPRSFTAVPTAVPDDDRAYGVDLSLTTTASRLTGGPESATPAERRPLHLSLLQSIALDGLTATLETASNLAAGPSARGSAMWVSARVDARTLDVTMTGSIAGPDFDAAIDDRAAAAVAAVFAPPVPGMKIDAAIALEQRGDRTFRREASAGVSQQLGRVGLKAGVDSRVEGDRLFGAAAETSDRLRAAASLGGEAWSAELSGSFTSSAAYPGPERTYAADAALSGSLRTASGAEIELGLSHTHPDLHGGLAASKSSLDAGVSGSVGPLALGAGAEWTITGLDPSRSLIGISGEASARVGDTGVLAAAAELVHDRSGTAGERTELGFRLTYATSVGVPYARDPSVGAVEGRVVDTVTGEPAGAVVVRVGDAVTITNERGEWTLPGLAAGDYRVAVDPSTVPDGRLVAESGATVSVVARETVRAHIELVAGGSLVGNVVEVSPTLAGLVDGALAEAASRDWRGAVSAGLARSAPAAGRTVTITDGVTTRSVRTDSDGAFRFERLEPGVWYLSAGGVSERIDVDSGEPSRVELAEIVRRAPVAVQGGGTLSLP